MPSQIQESTENHEYEYPLVPVNLNENEAEYHTITASGNNVTNDKDLNIKKRTSSQKSCFFIPLLKDKRFLLPSILFILTLGVLIGVLIKNTQLEDKLSKKTLTIEQLNNQFQERNKERNISLILPGRKFGDDKGYHSDDSLLKYFTPCHYLSGFRFSDLDGLHACQFIYRSCCDNQIQVESNVYGDYQRTLNTTYEYYLNDDERIEQVRVQLIEKKLSRDDDSSLTIKMITGVEFITITGQRFPPDANLTGDGVLTESFPGYNLGYVTGRSALTVDQFQFFWYRT